MNTFRRLSPLDGVLAGACRALATLSDAVPARRPDPAVSVEHTEGVSPLSDAERRLSGALMRVNHVGEVCAQALYEGQAASTRDPSLRAHFLKAAEEEADHLAWTRARLDALGAHPSLLNPIWYAGALTLGLVAGRAGDRWSLGFMAETERQVEQHLQSHLGRLPAADQASRAVVEQMKLDETKHARDAKALGGAELPQPAKDLMKTAARIMTTVAHHV
jgi:ubiquinone biosynthesis monooxygenase Coq7